MSLDSWLGTGPPRAKTQFPLPKPLSNSLQIHIGMEHGSRLMILGPRGYAQQPKGEEPSFMSLGPCGHDYYDYRERRKSSNKKGPRSSNLGPRGFSICLLDMRHTRSQSSDHNVC